MLCVCVHNKIQKAQLSLRDHIMHCHLKSCKMLHTWSRNCIWKDLHLAPPLGVTSFEFRKDFWLQKTRVLGLSCCVVCIFLCLAILVERRLVTDTHIQTHGHSIYRAEHSSHGKNAHGTPESCTYHPSWSPTLDWYHFCCFVFGCFTISLFLGFVH